jgi:hypothetical protein
LVLRGDIFIFDVDSNERFFALATIIITTQQQQRSNQRKGLRHKCSWNEFAVLRVVIIVVVMVAKVL